MKVFSGNTSGIIRPPRRLYKGASVITPNTYSQGSVVPTVPPVAEFLSEFVIHAWDPDAGANANGVVENAVGLAPLRAVNESTPIPNWNGEIAQTSTTLLSDATDIADWANLTAATISVWVLFRAGTVDYHGIIACGSGSPNIFEGVAGDEGSVEIRRNGGTDLQMCIRTIGTVSSNAPIAITPDEWRMVTFLQAANEWKLIVDNHVTSVGLTWLSQVKRNTGRSLAFGHFSPTPISYLNNSGNNNGFRGRFGDIRVHNKLLSASEINQLYTDGRQSY